ncbi:MAG: 16S rRNA (adenine(1518)-N(6)/adenine(1519)-N(6))-dimethyltransferase RsmA [Proteobacteria bacterium]|nr:16S rRNA (adenine(1518)-N(6)/adenine(1519)-N(6))-dimethyltransferase RsmA [Pseudomonadota bacterium]
MSLPPLRDVIAKHDLMARKALGQNFLLDLNLTDRIAREAGAAPGATIYEVGPGPGGLTRSLLNARADRVIAVEKDYRCLPALAEIEAAYPGRLTVIEADAMKVDEPAQIAGSSGPVRIIANLPYNVSTILLAKWLSVEVWPPWFSSLTLMFQREVADRISAAPGSRTYGRLSVLSQWRTRPRRLFDLPPRAFVPAPKVTSSVVHFDILDEPIAPANFKVLQEVVQAAFGQRRKMLRSSLKALNVDVGALFDGSDIAADRRAETLSIQEFCELARALTRLREDD